MQGAAVGKANAQITMEQLYQELVQLNSPIQKSAKDLSEQIGSLNSAMEAKINECDRLCSSEELKQLDKLYDRGIELLEEFRDKQQTIIGDLRREGLAGNQVSLIHLKEKLKQIEISINRWIGEVPLVDRIIKIENELKRLEETCDSL